MRGACHKQIACTISEKRGLEIARCEIPQWGYREVFITTILPGVAQIPIEGRHLPFGMWFMIGFALRNIEAMVKEGCYLGLAHVVSP